MEKKIQWEKEFDEKFKNYTNQSCNMFVNTRQFEEIK